MPQPNGAGPASAANGASEQEPARQPQAAEVRSKKEEGRRAQPAEDTETSGSDLAEFLNLPAEARQAISQAKQQQKGSIRKPGSQEGAAGDAAPEGAAASDSDDEAASSNAEGDEDSSHEVDGEEESEVETVAQQSKPPQAPKGLTPDQQKAWDKKMAKLWRQRSSLKSRTTQLEQALQQAYGQIQQFQQSSASQATAAPRSAGVLGNVQSEQKLDQMVSEAENVIEMVEANPDGLTIGTGANERFVEPRELAEWKRKADAILRGEPRRREQLKQHAQQLAQMRQQRQGYDEAAQQHFPELFDETSDDYATAVQLLQEAPVLAQHPAANFLLGMMVDWYKRNGRKGSIRKPGNQEADENATDEGEEKSDLDPRLTPEHQRKHIPPLAPTAAKPPTRNGAIASRFKDAEKIAERFTRPGGASTADLADMLRATTPDNEAAGKPRRLVSV